MIDGGLSCMSEDIVGGLPAEALLYLSTLLYSARRVLCFITQRPQQ